MRKKLLLFLLGVLTILPTFAQDFEYTFGGQTLKYSVLDEEAKTCKTRDAEFLGAVSESKINNNNVSGELIIPSTVTFNGKDYTVVEIGNGSFSGDFTSVEIPNTVTTIHWGAFSYCDGLTVVTFPASVTNIEQAAFNACRNLRAVYITNPRTKIKPRSSEETEIEKEYDSVFSFGKCDKMVALVCPPEFDESNLNLPSSIKVIHTENFAAISVLEDNSILDDFGKTLIYAGIDSENGACIIPDGVEKILSTSFNTSLWDSVVLSSLSIPASVNYIESNAFRNVYSRCINFQDWDKWYDNITMENIYSNPYLGIMIGGGNTGVDQHICIGGVQASPSPKLYEGMTEIKDYVNCGLVSNFRDEIELPTTLKRVGAFAFFNNKELYNVFLNDGLEEIGEAAFLNCPLLENPIFPSSLKEIGSGAYEKCTSITEIILPENLRILGKGVNPYPWATDADGEYNNYVGGVFSGCTSLEKAAIAVDIDSISDYLFYGCNSLYKVYLPTNLRHIGERSFYNCQSLDEISFPSSLESIGTEAFKAEQKGRITKLVIPNSVREIGPYAFSNQSIENLKIGSGLEKIEPETFKGNSLNIIEFSEGLTAIENGAFSDNCSILSSVILPSTLTEIGEKAFENTSICELIIPDKITSLPSRSCGRPSMLTVGSGIKEIAADAFSFDNLISFRLKATMPPTLSDAFPLTEDQNDQLTLVVNQGRKDRYTTNARWKQIDNIIEDGDDDVTVYLDGQYPLAEEIRMQSGLMPGRVRKLKVVGPLSEDDLAIMRVNMVSLKSLDLSEVTNIKEIHAGQFGQSMLTEISLPNNVETIGDGAFSGCILLRMSEIPETVKNIGSYAFSGCIGVSFTKLPESVESLGNGVFSGCTGIEEFTFNNNIEGILPAGIFSGCSNLGRVDLSKTGIEGVGSGAFAGCQELDEILLPQTVRSIEGNAFAGTAIRDLSFLTAEVDNIGYGAFSSCRRLVSANLPKNVISVSESLLASCPRLLSVSMGSQVENVSGGIIVGNRKLSNISCAAQVAPQAEIGAFSGIRLRYVSLTVPTLSFRSYLNAQEWGKFESIQNRIPVEIDGGVDVSNVSEDDYQSMLREDELEAAQEAAAEERDSENSEQLRRRAARRAAARVNTRSFAALFDGAQINCGSEGSGTRIFLNPEENVIITSVKFQGKEMLNNIENNSILLPAGSAGSLEIRTNYIDTGIEEVSSDINFESAYDVYDLNGLFIGHDIDGLDAGIYVVRQKGAVKKISVR